MEENNQAFSRNACKGLDREDNSNVCGSEYTAGVSISEDEDLLRNGTTRLPVAHSQSSRNRWDLKRPQPSSSEPSFQSTSASSLLTSAFSQERNDWVSSPTLSSYSRHTSTIETQLENAPWNWNKSSSDPTLLSNKQAFNVTNATFSLVQRSDKRKVRDALERIKTAVQLYLESPNPDSPLLAFHNLSSLIQYAQDDYYRIVIVNLEGISIIVQAMNVFIKFADIQASACAALISLCQRSEKNQLGLIAESMGLSCIVEVLERHTHVTFLTNVALEVLNVATSTNPLGIQHLRTKSMSNGASFEAFLRYFPESLLLPEAKNSLKILLSRFSIESSENDNIT